MNFPELLICAQAGDNAATERILAMYQPLLVKESWMARLMKTCTKSFACNCFFAFENSTSESRKREGCLYEASFFH